MTAYRFGSALVVALLLGASAAIGNSLNGLVGAEQAGTPTAQRAHGHDANHREGQSSYADRFDAAATIRSLTPEQIDQIERGEGAGFALPAELNGVPGPRHVLDLAAELDLTPDQEADVEAIFAAMHADVLAAGNPYLDAVRALETGFRDGTLTLEDLPDRVAEVKRLEGELATAHLTAHLKTAAILTPEQVETYSRLRGYE